MEQLAKTLSFSRPVLLAHEDDFDIGQMTVRPSRLQVECGDRCERVEPRVMKVIVALSKAEGAVVTRDELIDSCWDGRIVGEDAIQRVLSRFRHLATDVAKSSFQLETVRGVGCRLVAPQFASDGRTQTSVTGGTHWLRRFALGIAVALAIAVGLGLYLLNTSGAEAEPASVAVLPFKNLSAGDSYFAEGVAEEIANQLSREPQFKVAGRTSSELFRQQKGFRLWPRE